MYSQKKYVYAVSQKWIIAICFMKSYTVQNYIKKFVMQFIAVLDKVESYSWFKQDGSQPVQ